MVPMINIDETARALVSLVEPRVPIDDNKLFGPNSRQYMAEWHKREFEAQKAWLLEAQALTPQPKYEPIGRPETALAPTAWDDYVGQRVMKLRLQVAMKGAASRNEPIHPMLFLAHPGAGKTTIAELMADAIGVELVAITRPVSPAELIEQLVNAPSDALLFIDECHQLPSKTAHVLMQLTEDKRIDTAWGTESFDALNIVMATTEKEKVNDALRSRCQVVEWDPYSEDEMTEIVTRMAERAKVELPEKDCRILAHASSGVPRRARKFISSARDMAAADLPLTADLILEFVGCTRDGLERDHIAYLNALVEMQGQAGLDPIATRLRLNVKAVKELERTLLDKRLVTLGPRGRVLTAAGRKSIKKRGH